MAIKIDEEFKNLIPPLTTEEYKQLEENILRNGIHDSIKTWDGIIIDGHNRWDIINKNQIKDWSNTNLKEKLPTREDVKIWIINNQLGRRNINTYQRGVLALKLQEILKVKGKENKKKAGSKSPDLTEDFQISEKVNSAKEASDKFNVSHDTLNKIKHIEEKASPEVKEKLSKGEITVNKAFTDIKKEEKREEIANKKMDRIPDCIDIYNTKNKYKIIYADPPWSYNNNTTGTQPKDHYKLMNLKDICDMPIKTISEENAVLFLWVVVPQIEEALQVIKSWGFKYKTHFIWDKIKHNMGHYSSVRHELLFICTKGSCMPEYCKLFDSVYSEERTEHSKKPEYFRDIINILYPNGNRIELFARCKMKGWDFYGNECN